MKLGWTIFPHTYSPIGARKESPMLKKTLYFKPTRKIGPYEWKGLQIVKERRHCKKVFYKTGKHRKIYGRMMICMNCDAKNITDKHTTIMECKSAKIEQKLKRWLENTT